MDNTKEIERLLLQNLKLAKENNTYLIKVDRRQRWSRNMSAFYWLVLIVLAVGGYYYAFPYLKEFKENVSITWQNFSSFVSINPFNKEGN